MVMDWLEWHDLIHPPNNFPPFSFYTQLFNARTTQLVLGAGAIQATAKLRSITAKHLGR